MKDYTDITVLVDRSGSMQNIASAMESGFDEFLQKHRENPSTRITLIQFDGNNPQDVVYVARPVADAGKLVIEPRGMTPLRDALCEAIDSTGSRLARLAESERPDKVLLITVTDGLENASQRFSREDVRRRIDTQQRSYNWEFVYLGANQDAIKVGQDLGFDWKKSMTYTADAARSRSMWGGVTSNTLNYATTGLSATLDWSNAQRKESVEDSSQPGVTGTSSTTSK